MKTLLFILALAAASFAQVDIVTQAAKPPIVKGDASTVEVNYNKFKDITLMRSQDSKLYAEGRFSILYPDVTFSASSGFMGEKAGEEVRYYLHFRFESPDWRFLGSGGTDIIILMGSARMALKGDRSGDVSTSGRKVSVVERLMFSLSRNQMEVLANTPVIELQIGSAFQTTLSDKDRELLLSVIAAVEQKKK